MKPCTKNAGMTLVELIVVLVILAVLAALLVPSLTGYIDKANEASVIAEARTVLTAAQATVTEAYAKGELKPDRTNGKFGSPDAAAAPKMAKQILDLSEIDNDHCEWRFYLPDITNTDLPTAKISQFTYCNKKYCVTYRAIATDSEPAGWGTVTRASTLPDADKADGEAFLSSDKYNPDVSEPSTPGTPDGPADQPTTGGDTDPDTPDGTNPDTGDSGSTGSSESTDNPDNPDLP